MDAWVPILVPAFKSEALAGVSVLRVARGCTSSVPKRLVRFPAFRSDFVSAF